MPAKRHARSPVPSTLLTRRSEGWPPAVDGVCHWRGGEGAVKMSPWPIQIFRRKSGHHFLLPGVLPHLSGRCARILKYASKPLKTLERVKGIEPSYSAWKAAALPLSYTRLWADHVSRQASRLNRPAPVRTRKRPCSASRIAALNRRRFDAYSDVSINNERR
jgi:hypothetical protein